MNAFLKNGSGMYECSTNNYSYSTFGKIKNIQLRGNGHFMFEQMWNLLTPIKLVLENDL